MGYLPVGRDGAPGRRAGGSMDFFLKLFDSTDFVPRTT